jgi:hypothetical protein
MTDPMITAARRITGEAFDTLRRVADGLPVEALNWEPAGPDTNSIAVLTAHAMSATRLLLYLAVGLPLPERDRSAEFRATAQSSEELLGFIDDLAAQCEQALDEAGAVDWSEVRRRSRDDGSVMEMSAAYALLHAVDHLRGHADEASLTRHVWSEQSN